METTTTQAIAQAIVAKLHDIKPRHQHAQAERWKFTPGPRQRGQARHLLGTDTRSFDLIFEPGRPDWAWFGTGTAYATRLRIATSYSAVPPEIIEHMITDDRVDLYRALRQLVDVVPGFSCPEPEDGGANETDDTANTYVEHTFRVHWHQNTDAA
ncbi:hypothetical protein OV203_02455 [Nannocystis sp. ILAH1]|uniref:hypothetical protein n=1 Tax=Nannocystis sp. ILAH1 TaxID=2996789 RepID=UPI002270D032|nr:hypothetical protein [Nannocystis sp. ILAH1]MCY0985973.1 hypothetical protein [Nannocystis sp. ILAH1]